MSDDAKPAANEELILEPVTVTNGQFAIIENKVRAGTPLPEFMQYIYTAKARAGNHPTTGLPLNASKPFAFNAPSIAEAFNHVRLMKTHWEAEAARMGAAAIREASISVNAAEAQSMLKNGQIQLARR